VTGPLRSRLRAGEGQRERYGLLLGAIVSAFLVQGISTPGAVEQVVVSALLGATLLLALWAADVRPRVMRVATLMASAVVVASVAESLTGNVDGAPSRLANLLLVTLAPPAVVIGLIRSLRARREVTVATVFGVLCLYMLIGMFFSFVYGAIGQFSGESFFTNGAPDTVAHCLYFSFTTLTTVGYGDFTAATNLGHTLSVTEALLGQIYLVTVVAVIVSNLGRRPQPEPQQE
jgi:hypothetical protein